MDQRLVAWGRAVKQRRRARLPVLWLFTDVNRLPDPMAAIARLPPGLCGVVFRHDGVAGRAELALRVAKLCRQRRLPLVVAGDARLATRVGAGIHLRGGRWPGVVRTAGLITSSAHDLAQLRRARRAGAEIIFLSPAFATPSHLQEPGLGALRWLNIAWNGGGAKPYALGGVNGDNVKVLARFCKGVGAIAALIH